MRSLVDQISHLCKATRTAKRDLAAYLGITPVYFSNMMRRGMPIAMIERVAKYFQVEATIFDEYVVELASVATRQDEAVLEGVRTWLQGKVVTRAVTDEGRRTWTAAVKDNSPSVVSVVEAARMLSVGKTMIYDMMNQGRLRFVRLGRLRRIPYTEIQRLARLDH